MRSLNETHSNIFAEFISGNFTASKCHKNFSSISIDHAHEQLNALIKGDGGAVGLTESDAALARWVIAGPEILRILQDFEVCVGRNSDDNKHHEQTSAFQKSYKTDVQKLLQVYVDIGNPFSETCTDDLLSLDTNTLMKLSVTVLGLHMRLVIVK